MNLAVKNFEFAPPGANEWGLPDDYPYQVVELGSSTMLPDNSGQWYLVDKAVWDAGAEARQAVFAAAIAAMNPPVPIYIVKAKCPDSASWDALAVELLGRDFEVEKIQS